MIISRYLVRQIIFPTLAITGIIIFVTMSNWMRNWLADALSGQGGSGDILFIIFYYIPMFIQEALPGGFLIGILIGYGKLYSELEMTALFACGFKYRQLVFSTLKPAVVMMMILWVNGLFISPWFLRHAADAWAEQESLSPIELLKPGQFTMLGKKGETIYVSGIDRESEIMQDIFMSTSLNEIYKAETGFLSVSPDSDIRYLVLQNGTVQLGLPGEGDYSVATFDTYGVIISENKAEPTYRRNMLTTKSLLEMGTNGAYSQLQWRIFSPFNLIIVLLIAIPMSKINPRQGRFMKIIPALILYSLYSFAQDEWLRRLTSGEFPQGFGLYVFQISVASIILLFWFLPGWFRKIKHGR